MSQRGLSLGCLIVILAALMWSVTAAADRRPDRPDLQPLDLSLNQLVEETTPLDGGGTLLAPSPGDISSTLSSSSWWIENIGDFLEKCPTQDLAFAQIRDDFKVRRNGSLVAEPSCSEPISEMPLSAYTNELIMWQALRLIYYLDLGQSGHLPWTGLNLYDWLSSKVAGINISDSAAYDYCCDPYPEGWYIVTKPSDDANRELKRKWMGLSLTVALLMHEARHMDGYGHIWCDGEFGGDANYDETDLTAFGIQWWLTRSWLDGDLYVGFSCLDPEEVNASAMLHMSALDGWRRRFCYTKAPETSMPSQPGGQCRPAPQPLVSFVSSSPDWLGQTTYVTNTSLTGDTVNYSWFFGRFWTYGMKDAYYTYEQPGQHRVILMAYSSTGSITSTETVIVYGPPAAHFVADPTGGGRPLEVAFTDTTTTTPSGDPTLVYSWQFGDGETSHQPDPSHTYVETGTYTVTLTVNNAAGGDKETKEEYITVRDVRKCWLPVILR